jgi:hypothetical protein
MDASPPPSRRLALLLEHCTRQNGIEDAGPTGVLRLRQAIGDELTRLLLSALVDDHRVRPSAV